MAASAATVLVSVDEYLHSVYEPDLDLVDGVLEDRNVGELDHWRIQRALLEALMKGEKRCGYFVAQETRLQISTERYRVPDTCLIARANFPEQILRKVPLLCIEVLSPEDRYSRMLTKCEDYLRMGVSEVWIVDPVRRVISVLRKDATTEHRDGVLRPAGLDVEVQVASIFGALDEE